MRLYHEVVDKDAGDDHRGDRQADKAGHEHLGHDVVEQHLALVVGLADLLGDFGGDDERSREAEQAGAGDAAGHLPAELEDLADDNGDDEHAEQADDERAEHDRQQAENVLRGDGGQEHEDGDHADHEADAVAVGLLHDVVLQEADLLRNDAHDEADDVSVHGAAGEIGDPEGQQGDKAGLAEQDSGTWPPEGE